MKIGIGLAGDVDEIGRSAELAEAAGFESAWVVELEHSAYVQAAAAALATSRIGVGTAIALAFPRPPVITAMEAADLAVLSGGRFSLGLGSQVRRIVEARFGIPYDRPAARMEDYVRAVKAVWAARRGEGTRYEGPFYRIERPTFVAGTARGHVANPMTDPQRGDVADPPILVAAVGPLMSRAAGRVADGVIGHPLASPAWLRAVVAPAIAEGLEEAGRPADACPITALPLVAVAADADAARRAAKGLLAFYATTPNYAGILRHHGRDDVPREVRRAFVQGDLDRMIAAIDDELLDAIAIAGRPDEARDRLERWAPVAGRVILAPPYYEVAEPFARELWHGIVDAFGRPGRRA